MGKMGSGLRMVLMYVARTSKQKSDPVEVFCLTKKVPELCNSTRNELRKTGQ